MNKTLVLGGIAVVAVFAGVVYFARDPSPRSPSTKAPPANEAAAAEAVKPPSAPLAVTPGSPPPRPATSDPRLAALMVSPDNGLIEYFADPDGRVIKEIDNDPESPGFRKPLREYTYAGDQVIRLVAYKYLGDQTQIIEANVVYKPDGSVDQYQESTRYEHGKRN